MNALTPIPAFGAEPTMSSLEIAELTGKRHDNVCADIRGMLFELKIDVLTFQEIYRDARNRQQACYRLPRRECLILASGYSTDLRAKIIDRWLELEARPAQPVLTVEQQLAQAVLLSQQVLQLKDERIEQLETEVKEMKPLLKVAEAGHREGSLKDGRLVLSAATLADTISTAVQPQDLTTGNTRHTSDRPSRARDRRETRR